MVSASPSLEKEGTNPVIAMNAPREAIKVVRLAAAAAAAEDVVVIAALVVKSMTNLAAPPPGKPQ